MTEITLQDGYFAPRQRTNIAVTIPSALKRCRETGRLAAFKREWTPDCGRPAPHIFWDSDVAKVMEGMAYAAAVPGGRRLRRQLDSLVKLVVSSQEPDGYLNSHFTVTDRDQRWSNLLNNHELYCAGHLIEAAVAHWQTTGSTLFLDAMRRYADLICRVFGPDGRPGIPGHEEIELALCKLYRATGERRYLEQAELFLNRRGTRPYYFTEVEHFGGAYDLVNRQSHLPVRQQREAVGHAVRAVYLYCGMADAAGETGDRALLRACERLFDDIAEHKMYLTGGIGSTNVGEAFSAAGDLPADRNYAESCAAMGLVLFASRMLRLTGRAKYAEVLERTLCNGALSGLSLSGDRFFYANLLECHDATLTYGHVTHERQPWYDCSCCPTSYCRFLPQIGNFCYRADGDKLFVDIPAAAEIEFAAGAVTVSSGYPYDGEVTLRIRRDGVFTLACRVPGWCEAPQLPEGGKVSGGYWRCRRRWRRGEELRFNFPMTVRRIYSSAAANYGQFALQRGPLVYCVESLKGSRWSPWELAVSPDAEFTPVPVPDLPAGTVGLQFRAAVRAPRRELYSEEPFRCAGEVTALAVPYALWQNRGPSQMSVYLHLK